MNELRLLALVAGFALGISSGATLANDPESLVIEGSVDSFLGSPKMEMQQVFSSGRFPNVVVTSQGTVIATWGKKHIRARRSGDGGKTWGEAITIAKRGFQGGGTTVDETSGDILAFVEDKHPPAPLTIYRSQDDGKTWLAELPTMEPDSNGNLPSMHMNEHGITLRHGQHKGRLLRPSRYYGKKNHRSQWPNHYTNAIICLGFWQVNRPEMARYRTIFGNRRPVLANS